MEIPPLDILYEDNHCLALAKPAGCLSTHYQGKEETLDRAVKAYLKEKYQKPGNVFIGVVHRLDASSQECCCSPAPARPRLVLPNSFAGYRRKDLLGVVEGMSTTTPVRWKIGCSRTSSLAESKLCPRETPGAKQALLHFHTRAVMAD